MRAFVTAGLCLAIGLIAVPASAQRFDFMAFGDMPYTVPGDYEKVERLVDRINQSSVAFTIFIGDTKAGSTPCSNEMIQKSKEILFDRIAGAVIYSVGDNEWTDCHRRAAGGFDPLERLDYVRRQHFSKPESLGHKPLALTRQADLMPRYTKYIENSRWTHNEVLFVSVHIPGSNNNFERRPGAPDEYFDRNTANLAWINAAFEEAVKPEVRGLVFAYQADMWSDEVPTQDTMSGYADTIDAFSRGAEKVGKPVLLINGDKHLLRIDQPLKGAKKETILNAMRLQVMGASEIHAVRVTVDPENPMLFSFTPFFVVENMPKRN